MLLADEVFQKYRHRHPVVPVQIQIQRDPLKADIVSLMPETVVVREGMAFVVVLGMVLGSVVWEMVLRYKEHLDLRNRNILRRRQRRRRMPTDRCLCRSTTVSTDKQRTQKQREIDC
jgi:hypothetical protein